jgi:hypothetical protein
MVPPTTTTTTTEINHQYLLIKTMAAPRNTNRLAS